MRWESLKALMEKVAIAKGREARGGRSDDDLLHALRQRYGEAAGR